MRVQPAASRLDIYREQLTEIEADAQTGRIAPSDASAARLEVARRMLAADDPRDGGSPLRQSNWRRAIAVAALIVIPAVAATLYLRLGSPGQPDAPLAARQVAPAAADSLQALVARVEAHLEKNPGEGEGWKVLAPALMRLGRFDDAAKAYRKVIDTLGETASRRADLGEARMASANGVVTADAKAEFDRAVALDSDEPKARFFLGLAARQDGRLADAVAIWQAMLAKSPADAPWTPLVRKAISDAGVAGGETKPEPGERGPSDADVRAADQMSAADRTAMIGAMVDRLAERLKQQPNDVDGWARLMRSYDILGQRAKARQALEAGRAALADNAEALTKLNAAAAAMGL